MTNFLYAALALAALTAAAAAETETNATLTATTVKAVAMETATVVTEALITLDSSTMAATTESSVANTTQGVSGTFVKTLLEHRMAPEHKDRNLTSIYIGSNAVNVSGGLFTGFLSYKNLSLCHLDEIRDSITFFVSNTTIQGSVLLPRLAIFAEDYQVKDARLEWPSNQTVFMVAGGPGPFNATFFDIRADLQMLFSKVNETTVELESVDMTPSSGNCSVVAEKALVNGEPVDFERFCSSFNDQVLAVLWTKYKEEVLKGLFGRLFHRTFQVDDISEYLKKYGGEVNYAGV